MAEGFSGFAEKVSELSDAISGRIISLPKQTRFTAMNEGMIFASAIMLRALM